MRTGRTLLWRTGGTMMGVGFLLIALAASQWGKEAFYSVWGTMMLVGLVLAAMSAGLLGWALRQVAIREILRQRGLRVRVEAAFVARKKRGRGYFIYAKCVSPVIFEEVWVKSVLLLDDPTPYLRNGVEVLFDSGYPVYYMLAEELETRERFSQELY